MLCASMTSLVKPWDAVRKAHEQELKYFRDMNEKPMQSTSSRQLTRSGSTQRKHSRESQCKSDQESLRENSKNEDRPDLCAGTPPLKALKCIISIATSHKETFSMMHIDVSRANFHAKARRPVLVRLPLEDRVGADVGKVGLSKTSMYGARDAGSNWEWEWQEHVENWGFPVGRSSKNLFYQDRHQRSGMTWRRLG